jgi:mannose-6-phosphate isomerase
MRVLKHNFLSVRHSPTKYQFLNIIKFDPLYQERPWGGTTIKEFFDRKIKLKSNKIGESWEIVDRPEAQSLAINGTYKRRTLRQIISNHCQIIMGPNWSKNARFPILVKWLDCTERLSLQVHPPEEVAHDLGGEPKTENWYIANATENAALFIGHKRNVSKQKFKSAITSEKVETLCHRVKSKEGDSILVESGRIHAIDQGNLILEIQQNSDTTYRVYDWGRLGINNKPRELHIEESLKSINFNDIEPTLLNTQNSGKIVQLAKCKFFRITKYDARKGEEILIKKAKVDCAIIHLVSGFLKVGKDFINKGEQVLSPYESECILTVVNHSTFLVTDQFVNKHNLGGIDSH